LLFFALGKGNIAAAKLAGPRTKKIRKIRKKLAINN